jgi:hypothetical protein
MSKVVLEAGQVLLERLGRGVFFVRPPRGLTAIVAVTPPGNFSSIIEVEKEGGVIVRIIDEYTDPSHIDFEVLMVSGRPEVGATIFSFQASPQQVSRPSRPLVSALMVTQPGRVKMARRAIECFCKQLYPFTELVVVSAGDVSALGVPFHQVPDPGISLGELRNVALARATGDLVAIWDDDDLSTPERLSVQVKHLLVNPDADACLLSRVYFASRGRLGIAGEQPRGWEPTLVAWKEELPAYQPLDRGEDTALIANLYVTTIDEPALYTYVFHGENTCGSEHFENIFRQAVLFSEGDARLKEHRLKFPGLFDL